MRWPSQLYVTIWQNDLDKFKMPTCLIWGKNDNITPPDVAEEFHKHLEDSELHWIDKCGHAGYDGTP